MMGFLGRGIAAGGRRELSPPRSSAPSAIARRRPRCPRTVADGRRCVARARSGREIPRRFPGPLRSRFDRLLAQEEQAHCPLTSSAGRLFDAATALLGLRRASDYEGQAAMELEALAAAYGPAEPLADGYHLMVNGQLDLLPLLAWLADHAAEPACGAAPVSRYPGAGPGGLGRASRTAGSGARHRPGRRLFLNRLLSIQVRSRLERNGLHVYEAHQAPPNDGGLSLDRLGLRCRFLLSDEVLVCV